MTDSDDQLVAALEHRGVAAEVRYDRGPVLWVAGERIKRLDRRGDDGREWLAFRLWTPRDRTDRGFDP